ncbi:MAG: HlyD family secretion protein [Lysobacter sp.]
MSNPPSAPRDPELAVNPPAPTDAASEGGDTATSVAPSTPPPSPPKTIKPGLVTVVAMTVVAVVGIALILWAWNLWPFTSAVVSTDNGYVRGPITVLAPQVNGYVSEVLVKDFQDVEADQPLVRIDDRVYRARVEQAQAQLDNARAQLANAEQSLAQDRANIRARRADLAAAAAEERRARTDEVRTAQLANVGAVSTRESEQSLATEQLASANVLKAQAQIAVAEETVKATQVSRKGLQAQVDIAEAQLALARIDLDNTVVRAPKHGQLSQVSVRLGQYVTAGSQLLFLVPDALWVVANFKESQTWMMRIGQPVSFAVDAFDGERLTGRVEQIAPATGSEFSVLAPDNASGNFTKVVQRLPVRIAIDPDQPLAGRLRPGMSVVVRVDTSSGREPPKQTVEKPVRQP